MSALVTLGAALAGVATWTLLEYGLHRFFGHDRRTMPNPFGSEHTRHHSEGDYFAPTWKKALVALGVFAVVGPLAAVVAGLPYGPIYAASLAGMYVAYEVFHRRAHTHRGLTAWGRTMRRHHFHHHFVNPRVNHGVTSPVWDRVFGTLERPGRIPVPQRLKMRWLVDAATGEVRADEQPYYELRAR